MIKRLLIIFKLLFMMMIIILMLLFNICNFHINAASKELSELDLCSASIRNDEDHYTPIFKERINELLLELKELSIITMLEELKTIDLSTEKNIDDQINNLNNYFYNHSIELKNHKINYENQIKFLKFMKSHFLEYMFAERISYVSGKQQFEIFMNIWDNILATTINDQKDKIKAINDYITDIQDQITLLIKEQQTEPNIIKKNEIISLKAKKENEIQSQISQRQILKLEYRYLEALSTTLSSLSHFIYARLYPSIAECQKDLTKTKNIIDGYIKELEYIILIINENIKFFIENPESLEYHREKFLQILYAKKFYYGLSLSEDDQNHFYDVLDKMVLSATMKQDVGAYLSDIKIKLNQRKTFDQKLFLIDKLLEIYKNNQVYFKDLQTFINEEIDKNNYEGIKQQLQTMISTCQKKIDDALSLTVTGNDRLQAIEDDQRIQSFEKVREHKQNVQDALKDILEQNTLSSVDDFKKLKAQISYYVNKFEYVVNFLEIFLKEAPNHERTLYKSFKRFISELFMTEEKKYDDPIEDYDSLEYDNQNLFLEYYFKKILKLIDVEKILFKDFLGKNIYLQKMKALVAAIRNKYVNRYENQLLKKKQDNINMNKDQAKIDLTTFLELKLGTEKIKNQTLDLGLIRFSNFKPSTVDTNEGYYPNKSDIFDVLSNIHPDLNADNVSLSSLIYDNNQKLISQVKMTPTFNSLFKANSKPVLLTFNNSLKNLDLTALKVINYDLKADDDVKKTQILKAIHQLYPYFHFDTSDDIQISLIDEQTTPLKDEDNVFQLTIKAAIFPKIKSGESQKLMVCFQDAKDFVIQQKYQYKPQNLNDNIRLLNEDWSLKGIFENNSSIAHHPYQMSMKPKNLKVNVKPEVTRVKMSASVNANHLLYWLLPFIIFIAIIFLIGYLFYF